MTWAATGPAEEAAGRISVRSPTGHWFDVVYDVEQEESDGSWRVPPGACDGCGQVYASGGARRCKRATTSRCCVTGRTSHGDGDPRARVRLLKLEVRSPSASESDAVAMLTRISMDIRGVRPSIDDVDAVVADASVLDSLVDEYLEDPRFPERMIDLYSEIYLTRSRVLLGTAHRSSTSTQMWTPSLTRAPSVMSRCKDLGDHRVRGSPYTDVVTPTGRCTTPSWPACTQPTTQQTAQAGRSRVHGWSTDGRRPEHQWHVVALRLDHLEPESKRANQISRIFLCNDYLTRPIAFDRDVNLLDEDAVNDAIENDPGCVACHVSWIPSRAISTASGTSTTPVRAMPPPTTRNGNDSTTGSAVRAGYGQSGGTLSDLGHHIAADPRFIECAVEQAYTRLMGRDAVLMDGDALALHREAFLAGRPDGARAVPFHPEPPSVSLGHRGTERLRHQEARDRGLLASQVEGITGFRWTQGGTDMMASDAVGVGNLAGRADGYRMVRDSRSPMPPCSSSAQRPGSTARHDARGRPEPRDRSLFSEVTFAETAQTDRAAMTAPITHSTKLLLGRVVEPDGDEVEANLALWEELYAATDSAHVAWGGLLIALLRDPDFLMY